MGNCHSIYFDLLTRVFFLNSPKTIKDALLTPIGRTFRSDNNPRLVNIERKYDRQTGAKFSRTRTRGINQSELTRFLVPGIAQREGKTQPTASVGVRLHPRDAISIFQRGQRGTRSPVPWNGNSTKPNMRLVPLLWSASSSSSSSSSSSTGRKRNATLLFPSSVLQPPRR